MKFERLHNEPLYQSVIRWLTSRESANAVQPVPAKQGGQQHLVRADVSGPQPVARILDEAEDLIEPCGCTLQAIDREYQQKFGRYQFERFLQVQAREGSRKEPGIDKKPTAPDVAFCEIVIDEYHGFVRNCGRTAIGLCIRCGLHLCEDCKKYDGSCSTEGSPWHVFEANA